jgi:hypothetical protein
MTSALPLAVIATTQIPAFAVGLANDLNRSHRPAADGDIDVVDEEVPAREHLVDVGSNNWNLRIADDVTGRSPVSCDGGEASVRNASGGVGHYVSPLSCLTWLSSLRRAAADAVYAITVRSAARTVFII